ncbi:hypothetical protein DFJ77DRAFT_510357 [Powellomyces hirtus]|nr:hypothetical protein DFJ77DRAFT_510357 [Powellomyces hirtus]
MTAKLIAINIFTVKPGKQSEFIQLMKNIATRTPPPGCKTIQLHASVDGKTVLNRSEWESLDAFENRFNDQSSKGVFSQMKELVDGVDQKPYWFDEENAFTFPLPKSTE